MTFCAVVARRHSGVRMWVWAGAAVLCFAGGSRLAYGMFATGGRVASLFMAGVLSVYLLVVAFGAGMEDDRGWTPVEMLSLFAITATVGGI